MTTYEPTDTKPTAAELADRLRALESPAVYAWLERQRRRLEQDVGDVPSLEEVQEMLQEALGDRPIKEILDEVRGNGRH